MSNVDEMTEKVATQWGTALKEKHSRDEVLNDNSLREFYEDVLEDITLTLAKEFFDFSADGISTRITGRLRRALANVRTKNKDIKYNPKILEGGVREVVDTVAHELAHIATGASDGTWKFERFCKERDISLTADEIGVDDYWEMRCPEHGLVGRKTRRSKHIKQAEEGLRVCQCGEELEVNHIQK